MIKKYFRVGLFLLFVCTISTIVQAQKATAYLLKEPAGWEFERFDLPPVFAPGFPFKGIEELRFSPGMFKKDSVDYFTYAFVAQLDNTVAVSQDDIQNYLLLYYKGLCSSTAKDRKLTVDITKITVSIARNKTVAANEMIYHGQAGVFGVFADGAPVQLNTQIKVFNNAEAKKTYLLFLVSPQKRDHVLWKKLYGIQKDFVAPVE